MLSVFVRNLLLHRWIIVLIVDTVLWLHIAQCDCPAETDLIRRVGSTRFYILHRNQRVDYVDFQEGYAECAKYGMQMAKIENMRTLAVVGRPLEKIQEANKLMDTWYWLDAKWNPNREIYEWGQNGSQGDVQFSNFLYRPPRPTGVAGFVNYKGEYLPNASVDQCLMLALPWPGKGDSNAKGLVYGHHTMIDERPCVSKQKRHVICEATDPTCRHTVNDPFILTEDKGSYFEQGNWIFGDRRYIVNWVHRTRDESKAYCESLGLELFQPEGRETGLIPYLKMWSREVTVSSFWTAHMWNSVDKKFVNPANSEVATGHNWTVKWGESMQARSFRSRGRNMMIRGRSNKQDVDFCVGMVHSYEYNGQKVPCEDKTSPDCEWSFVDFVPANCNNYLGTICQHSDKSSRESMWDPSYVNDVNKGLVATALTKEFGAKGNLRVLRSKYKQTFGSLYCPNNYRMVRANTHKWYGGRVGDYSYDYKETYWVVDDDLFSKDLNSQCTISEPSPINGDGRSRSLRQVSCTEWHFYACEIYKEKRIPYFTGYTSPQQPTMVWKEGPQPRIYPLVTKTPIHDPITRKSENINDFITPKQEENHLENPWRPIPNSTHINRYTLKTFKKTKKAFSLYLLSKRQ